MTPHLRPMGGSWRRLRRSSPTRAIRSFTTHVRIWLPTVGPGVWFCRLCLSIACRIIFFLRGWSYWMVSSLPRPPPRGLHLWRRTSLLHLRRLLNFLQAVTRWRLVSVPLAVSARLWGCWGPCAIFCPAHGGSQRPFCLAHGGSWRPWGDIRYLRGPPWPSAKSRRWGHGPGPRSS